MCICVYAYIYYRIDSLQSGKEGVFVRRNMEKDEKNCLNEIHICRFFSTMKDTIFLKLFALFN